MMGNYTLRDAIDPVQITPLGQEVLNNPRAMERMGTDIAGMSAYQPPQAGVLLDAEPAGAVYGQEGQSFFSATPEDDTNVVMKAISTVLGAPFNLLRAGKEGLEEVIGHPYAMQRQGMDDRAEMMAHMLSDSEKALVGMPFDRTGINNIQTSTETVATGRSTGITPILTPRKTGIVELFTGENRKRRAREMMALQEAMKLRGIQLDWSKTGSEILKNNAGAHQSYQAGEGERIKNEWLPSNMMAYQDVQYSQSAQNRAAAGAQHALAGKYGAEAGLANARTDEVRTLTPAKEYREYASGNRAQAAADKDWALLPAQVAKENTAAIGNLARASASVAKEVATGRPSLLQATTALNSANTPEEKESTAAGLGIDLVSKPPSFWNSVGFGEPDKVPDLAGYAKKLDDNAPKQSAMELLQGLIRQVEDMKRAASTGEKKPPTVADPAPLDPKVNTDSWTPQQWDAAIPPELDEAGAVEWLVANHGKSRKQAADIVRAIAFKASK